MVEKDVRGVVSHLHALGLVYKGEKVIATYQTPVSPSLPLPLLPSLSLRNKPSGRKRWTPDVGGTGEGLQDHPWVTYN